MFAARICVDVFICALSLRCILSLASGMPFLAHGTKNDAFDLGEDKFAITSLGQTGKT
jgi:hypothetical protein